ncbi:MAG TPA: xanthine dehydrogenase family protein molybdopterin-binding subunit [Phenylobacterium sp.]|uniref:xanthine dehydrogenase family protein molybdopterin-binding subunit n=1 Tax=Phenylobacterium sp. TaxID=1871053 RepID=UPI002BE7D6CF|nr:xanthine dehydrogenase family protein molybdopterin-binding subunit [Phenylobacterium sp.]HSV04717.1 xanthine dehydrogenase family protein molybdopterin-binding subunit [Phenylobacterium sp.]
MAAQVRIGEPMPRVDGAAKVTGQALFPADETVAGPAYAFLVTSAVARGRVARIDAAEAEALPGVLLVLTHENTGGEVKPPAGPGGQGGTTTTLESDRVWHDGQIVAVVVADSYEIARDAARRVKIGYAAEPAAAGFDSAGTTTEPAESMEGGPTPKAGDAEAAFAAAPVKVDARYSTPTQHHNAMELFTTTCLWRGDELVVYEPSQFVGGVQSGLARQLGVPREKIRVISKFVGGGFGGKGGLTARTAWIALAARRLRRPVKLAATRDQGFTIATYRAETRHRIRLAADRQGHLQALIHQGDSVTSRPSKYNANGLSTSGRLYACPNVLTEGMITHADRNTPGFMRAPPETPFLFPLECAMDELAAELAIDPIELRRINDTRKDPTSGKPYTSRSLMRCFDEAARAFGWSRRDPKPGAMRDGEWLIGWGCASAAYSANIGAGACRVSLTPEGKAHVQIAAHELGTGSYTILTQVAADRLGLRPQDVTVEIGDSALPPAGISAGSSHASTICNVLAKACEEVRARLAQAAVAANRGPFSGQDPAHLTLSAGRLQGPDGRAEPLAEAVRRVGGVVEVHAENLPKGAPPNGLETLHKGGMAMSRGSGRPDGLAYAFGAQFVEVRVHERTREVRAPRAVGAFAAGRIINPTTARSQYMGGMIWGISSALHEATEIDRRLGRYYNKDFAEYLIPVNADVQQVDVIFVPEEDHEVNPLGMKGIGEIGIVGMNAAVANAVWHATGRRIRDLPIRIEKLL